MKKIVLILSALSLLVVSCNTYKYGTPGVMPTGKGELKRKQIKRDLTN